MMARGRRSAARSDDSASAKVAEAPHSSVTRRKGRAAGGSSLGRKPPVQSRSTAPARGPTTLAQLRFAPLGHRCHRSDAPGNPRCPCDGGLRGLSLPASPGDSTIASQPKWLGSAMFFAVAAPYGDREARGEPLNPTDRAIAAKVLGPSGDATARYGPATPALTATATNCLRHSLDRDGWCTLSRTRRVAGGRLPEQQRKHIHDPYV
ncbi:MAG: hypothetical protein QOI48_4430 [Solirubrobacteraceae bacterium]|jgi:hypothetical protein|nr:hypothetical protein [Solirubrobacteraceae bacterium]